MDPKFCVLSETKTVATLQSGTYTAASQICKSLLMRSAFRLRSTDYSALAISLIADQNLIWLCLGLTSHGSFQRWVIMTSWHTSTRWMARKQFGVSRRMEKVGCLIYRSPNRSPSASDFACFRWRFRSKPWEAQSASFMPIFRQTPGNRSKCHSPKTIVRSAFGQPCVLIACTRKRFATSER